MSRYHFEEIQEKYPHTNWYGWSLLENRYAGPSGSARRFEYWPDSAYAAAYDQAYKSLTLYGVTVTNSPHHTVVTVDLFALADLEVLNAWEQLQAQIQLQIELSNE